MFPLPSLPQYTPGSQGFQFCLFCQKSTPVSDSSSKFFCCLWESHVCQKSNLCLVLKSRERKNREIKLRVLMMVHSLQSVSESGQKTSPCTFVSRQIQFPFNLSAGSPKTEKAVESLVEEELRLSS